MAVKTAIRDSLLPYAALVLLGGAALTGCSDDAKNPVSLLPTQLYGGLHFNWPAVTMALTAPYDTVQLTATPVNALGGPLGGSDSVQYKALDSTVTVSPTGLVTANYKTNQTEVIATLTLNGVTYTDTAKIRVTTAASDSVLATLSIQPQPDGLDSAKVAVGEEQRINEWNGNIPVYAIDTQGDELCDLYSGCPFLIAFSTSDPSVATIDPSGLITTSTVGHVTFSASAYVYGVGRRDSLLFSVEYPIVSPLIITPGGTPTHLIPFLYFNNRIIGVGGKVTFENQIPQDDVVVNLPYNTPQVHQDYISQNLIYQMTDTICHQFCRTGQNTFEFDSAGTYTFHVAILGSGTTVDGSVIVQAGP